MKYILFIVLALVVGTMVFIFGLFGTDEKAVVVSKPAVVSTTENEVGSDAAEEARYAAIQAEYKILEKARRNLDRRLARIKAVMWNVQLPPEQAKDIISKMRKGYGLLKTKKTSGCILGVTKHQR